MFTTKLCGRTLPKSFLKMLNFCEACLRTYSVYAMGLPGSAVPYPRFIPRILSICKTNAIPLILSVRPTISLHRNTVF
jgi:hypothetical protein